MEPLLDRPDGGPLFLRPEGPVSAAAFLRHATALAAGLAPGRALLNLCRDRYAFAVAFAAGLMAGCTTLLNLPPEAAAPDCLVLADEPGNGALPVRPGTDPGGPCPAVPAIAPDHLAAIVYTSGSTGAAVPHRKHWGALAERGRAAATRFGLRAGTMVGTVPPHHMYGFETTVLLPFHAPVASWCGPAFFPADVLAALGTVPGPRFLVTTPLQLRALVAAGLDLPPFTAISATAPLDPALAADAEARWGGAVLEIFGATECGSIASRRSTAGPDWAAYPGIRLEITGAGTVVYAAGADPVPLADLLEATPAGFRLLGRRTDVVKRAGRRASLHGLNQALMALPGVTDGAFLLPDDAESRRLIAVVVAPGRTAPAILADLRRVIDPAFLPRRVVRVDALPRNAVGKLPRQALLDLVARAP